jgi:hypothetical protein
MEFSPNRAAKTALFDFLTFDGEDIFYSVGIGNVSSIFIIMIRTTAKRFNKKLCHFTSEKVKLPFVFLGLLIVVTSGGTLAIISTSSTKLNNSWT